MPLTLAGSITRLRTALAWRIRRVVGDARVDRGIVAVAKKWRPFLEKPVFIGITGSGGKTTTKELLIGILSHRQVGIGTIQSLNALPEVAKVILRVRRRHDYCVAEVSEDRPGAMDSVLGLLQPSIGIVTVIKDDHLAAFASREALAAEMSKLVTALSATGTAILNADDEEVLSMRALCKARVITYGIAPAADLRAEDVSSAWPDRLQMTLVHDSERVRVVTQLCGVHWVPAVLGAIGGGLATGMTLQECATAIATVPPFEGRMQPVTTPKGVTFIRDDFKAPLWTLDACFQFLKHASANKKYVVIGEISDIALSKEKAYANCAALSQKNADVSIFVGPWASAALKAQNNAMDGRLRIFNRVSDASAYINSAALKGDLVLLKGTNKKDHLLRIILEGSNEVACWRDDCDRQMFCNTCSHRMQPSGFPTLKKESTDSLNATPEAKHTHFALEANEQVIIGLGNPGEQFDNTPHNVGYQAVDQVATVLGLVWTKGADAWMARGELNGKTICLIKIAAPMNLIGDSLRQLGADMGFKPQQCILIFDDLDLPIGSVKTRQRGSAGGHKGVASILEAFQTDEFRRIKIGVGQAEYKTSRSEYVLTPFDEGDKSKLKVAMEKAVASIRSTKGAAVRAL